MTPVHHTGHVHQSDCQGSAGELWLQTLLPPQTMVQLTLFSSSTNLGTSPIAVSSTMKKLQLQQQQARQHCISCILNPVPSTMLLIHAAAKCLLGRSVCGTLGANMQFGMNACSCYYICPATKASCNKSTHRQSLGLHKNRSSAGHMSLPVIMQCRHDSQASKAFCVCHVRLSLRN